MDIQNIWIIWQIHWTNSQQRASEAVDQFLQPKQKLRKFKNSIIQKLNLLEIPLFSFWKTVIFKERRYKKQLAPNKPRGWQGISSSGTKISVS